MNAFCHVWELVSPMSLSIFSGLFSASGTCILLCLVACHTSDILFLFINSGFSAFQTV